jgi:hypothetical protein
VLREKKVAPPIKVDGSILIFKSKILDPPNILVIFQLILLFDDLLKADVFDFGEAILCEESLIFFIFLLNFLFSLIFTILTIISLPHFLLIVFFALNICLSFLIHYDLLLQSFLAIFFQDIILVELKTLLSTVFLRINPSEKVEGEAVLKNGYVILFEVVVEGVGLDLLKNYVIKNLILVLRVANSQGLYNILFTS